MQKAILISAMAATLYGCGIAPKNMEDVCDHANADTYGYVTDSGAGKIVMTGGGDMLRTGYWKADSAHTDCEGAAAVASTTTTGDTDAASGDGDSDAASSVERVRIDARVLFGFDSAVLTDAGKIELDLLISDMQALSEIQSILVVGHTDSIGSTSYNQMLSERRAASVDDYLAASLAELQINSEGRGESEPVADNGTAEGRERNRRVEVFVDGTAESAEQVAKAPVANKISELINKLTN